MSEVIARSVDAVEIRGSGDLDPILVCWVDVAPGKGYVIITCYGCAWTSYFGGMGGDTIREFFMRVGTDYLFTKLGITQFLKGTKGHEAYLSRIIRAVKAELTEESMRDTGRAS